MANAFRAQALLEKIRALPEEKVAEVEDFIDFLHQRGSNRHLTRISALVSENSLWKIWDNSDDAEYDQL